MSTVLERLPHSAHVAVIRLRSLGDCVLTTPALELLKRVRPDLRIAVVVEDRFAEIFRGNPDVEAILPPAVPALLRWRPRLALNLHGGTRSMVLTGAALARLRAGFEHHRYSWVYNVRIPRAQQILGVDRKVHTAEHLASAVFFLGIPPAPIPRAKLFAQSHLAQAPYAVIHPVAATHAKTWPAPRFKAVAAALAEHGLEPVFIGAAADDLSAFSMFRTVRGAPLSHIKSLLAGCSLFVGNDSGPAHMAAAFGIPVVVLFGPSDPVVWAPWRTEAQVFSSPDITGIEVNEVLRAVEHLRVAQ